MTQLILKMYITLLTVLVCCCSVLGGGCGGAGVTCLWHFSCGYWHGTIVTGIEILMDKAICKARPGIQGLI